ncbi:MAG: S46 family peptidase, partial [Gemmatimonadetes bacterium]|nr:S46 family peptidase [Gemmatimonadota bacterium]NIR99787.1 S46 family peptidase [Gemmatimonadota bacterium]NIT65376.1 S46 family peptidase [Gemmatimonadota bacterium]NIU51673.1 S46 family peptidase [Gemmatimonadota bacterium]NIV24410.1 S46 family peptidase [Gemmatimonadota bacterium]
MNVRNLMFSLSNSLKARTGQLAALRDPVIMKKKWDAERQLRQAIRQDAELSRRYGGLFTRIGEIQEAKEELGPSYGAFYAFGHPVYSSATVRRA